MRRLPENLFRNQYSGGSAVADTPRVEPSGDVEARRVRECAGKWNAVSGIVILVDLPPGDVANLEISPGPGFEVTEMLGDVPVLTRTEFGA